MITRYFRKSTMAGIATATALSVGFGGLASTLLSDDVQAGNVTANSETHSLDYCLFFAIDMSGSIQNGFPMSYVRNTNGQDYNKEADEWKIMMEGIAAALESDDFLDALKLKAYGRIALNYDFINASSSHKYTEKPWMIIDDKESAKEAAWVFRGLIENRSRSSGGTNLFETLEYSMDQVMDCPTNDPLFTKRTIDIKFDGFDDLYKYGLNAQKNAPEANSKYKDPERDESQDGAALFFENHKEFSEKLMKRARDQGIKINALTIDVDHEDIVKNSGITLEKYAEDFIMNGFAYPVSKWEHFAPVFRQKLIDDIAWDEKDLPVQHAALEAGSG